MGDAWDQRESGGERFFVGAFDVVGGFPDARDALLVIAELVLKASCS